MSKLRKATKKITAVAAASAIVASSVMAGGLGSYPSNFVEDGKFNGQVVVGSTADAMDSTNAQAIIADLEKEFSGDSDKVKITYKKSGTGGDELNAVRSNTELNYGEKLGDVSESAGFDDSDADVLEDGRFDNGVSDEDYEQTLLIASDGTTKYGQFNYALRDNVDGVDEIKEGIYFADGEVFAKYTLDMKTVINSAAWDDADFIGETLTIMGNEFTIGEITWTAAASGDLSKLVLLGGANKISLGEGETTTVTVEGKDYEIAVDSVSDTKVLLSVNGQTESISEYDSEEVAGINLAVTDLVESSRDAVKGYAEIVVGGQKITLEDGDKLVKINDEDIDEIYEDYEVYADFTGSDIDAIELTYKVSDDTLLEAGDSLEDVLFQAFRLEFEGTNEPEYTTIEFKVNDDDLEISGTTEDGEDLTLAFHYDGTDAGTGDVYLKGDQDSDRIFHYGSDLTAAHAGAGIAVAGGTNVTFDTENTGIKGSGFVLTRDSEEQYLYEITSVDTTGTDHEVDFDELLRNAPEEDIKWNEWDSKLGTTFTVDETATNTTNMAKADLGHMVAFEGEAALMLIAGTEDEAVDFTANTVDYVIALDNADVDADDAEEELDAINVQVGWDANDKEFNIEGLEYFDASTDIETATVAFANSAVTAGGVFVNDGMEDNEDGSSDVQTFVTKFGMRAEYDNDEKRSVKIMVPDEQVRANVNVVFGGSAAETKTMTVDADKAEETKEELKADGYTILEEEEMASEAVEFDVASATLDTEVSGAEDMIVVGGPAVNEVARELLGIEAYTVDQAGVVAGEGMIKFFEEENSVLVYGFSKEDTTAAVAELNNGGLSGTEKKVQ